MEADQPVSEAPAWRQSLEGRVPATPGATAAQSLGGEIGRGRRLRRLGALVVNQARAFLSSKVRPEPLQ